MSFRSLLIILLLGLLPPDGTEDGRTGNRHYEAGRYGAAARAYTRGLEAAPAEARAVRTRLYQNLGSARYRQEQFEDAQTAFDRGLRIAESADARATLAYNAGNAAFQREELQAAADYYRRALLADPSRRDAKYNYELVQRRLQQRRSRRSSSNSNRDSSSDSPSQSSSGSQNEQRSESRRQDGRQSGAQNQQRSSSSEASRPQDGQQSGQNERSSQRGDSEYQERRSPNQNSRKGENESQADRSSGDSGSTGEAGDPSARASGRSGDERQQLTREDAQRILRALEGSEKELLRELRRPPSEDASPPSDKDW